MNKLASKLPIQQMISNVISSAKEKLASDASEKKKVEKLVSYEKKEHGGHIPSVKEEEDEDKGYEKNASANLADAAWVEKLASAVEYISQNVDSIEVPQKSLLQKAAEQSGSPQGAGKGPGSLELNHPTPGTQGYKKNHPHGEDAAASEAGSPLSGAHEGDGKAQLENTMHHAPGQSGGAVPHAKYPAKGPLVAGPSAHGHHSKTASIADVYKVAGQSVIAKQKTASQVSPLRQALLNKLAGEDVMKANISAERSANPLAGMGQLESFDATQAAPHQSGDETGGYGNEARRLIASNQAAIDATKGEAKKPVKSQLGQVIDEPALNRGSDSKLEENLRNTGKAGVKIAAAREVLTKIASEGCTCTTIDGGCPFCSVKQKVAEAIQRKGSVKTANAMMGMGGGSLGASQPPSMPSSMGGGMSSMAEAGAGADGCTCGHTGQCRVCKLKAALAAAQMESGAAPAGNTGPMSSSSSPMGVGGAGGEKDSGMMSGGGSAGGIY